MQQNESTSATSTEATPVVRKKRGVKVGSKRGGYGAANSQYREVQEFRHVHHLSSNGSGIRFVQCGGGRRIDRRSYSNND